MLSLSLCNDEFKKFYLVYKQHVLSLSLYLSIQAHKQGGDRLIINNHLCCVVNWTNVILVSLPSVTYLQTNLEIIQGELWSLARTPSQVSQWLWQTDKGTKATLLCIVLSFVLVSWPLTILWNIGSMHYKLVIVLNYILRNFILTRDHYL